MSAANIALKKNNRDTIEYLMHKDLDVWFYGLELDKLAKLFHWEDGWDAYEFINQCDEWWQDADAAEREWFYNKYRDW